MALWRDTEISRRHMEIVSKEGRLLARDVGSSFGTRINGKSLQVDPMELNLGDLIMLGETHSFRLSAGSGAAASGAAGEGGGVRLAAAAGGLATVPEDEEPPEQTSTEQLDPKSLGNEQ